MSTRCCLTCNDRYSCCKMSYALTEISYIHFIFSLNIFCNSLNISTILLKVKLQKQLVISKITIRKVRQRQFIAYHQIKMLSFLKYIGINNKPDTVRKTEHF